MTKTPSNLQDPKSGGYTARGRRKRLEWVWSRSWSTNQDRKRFRRKTSHKPGREAGRRAECWKSACSVRRGGGWKPAHGSDSEALSTETESNG
jgi:hypothetical protein